MVTPLEVVRTEFRFAEYTFDTRCGCAMCTRYRNLLRVTPCEKCGCANCVCVLVKDAPYFPPEPQMPDVPERGTNPKDLIGVTKLPLRLIPSPALAFLSRVMALGAKKYGPFNWRSNKVKRTVYLEAALRHLYSVLDGEEIDPESGEPHEAHAMACMAILLDAKATGNLVDDRFTPGCFARLVTEMQEKKA